jgi:hypothetical protein
MITFDSLTLKEKDEIQIKFDKALGTVQCFLDLTCKELDRGSPISKDVWDTLKDQLDIKIRLMTPLCTTKLRFS